MKQNVNPAVFVSAIVVLVIIVGFFLYRSAQPPAPAKPPTAVGNTLGNPNSQAYRQGMIESMQKGHPHPQGMGQQ